MIQVTREKWDSIYHDYKGECMNYYNDKPEWLGRKVVMSGCISDDMGKLYVEGVHFEII